MRAIPRYGIAALTFLMFASTVHAQSISLGLRGTGSVPTGSFAQDQAGTNAALIEGAKTGFGYGLDVGLGFGPLGVYAGFDQIKFDCETATCQTNGKYTLQGVTAGLKLYPPMISRVRPYLKGGVTFNNLKGGYGGSSSNRLETDKTPGYEIGAGADFSILGLLAFTPQIRYVGQNLKAKVPGVNSPTATSQGVNYFSIDLGMSVHSPFGGR